MKQQFRLRVQVTSKKTLTLDTNDQTFNCDNANGHSLTGNRQKSMMCVTLFTHHHVTFVLHKLSVILDFTLDKKSWIAFQVQLVN